MTSVVVTYKEQKITTQNPTQAIKKDEDVKLSSNKFQ